MANVKERSQQFRRKDSFEYFTIFLQGADVAEKSKH
jgi:hypothetical protein